MESEHRGRYCWAAQMVAGRSVLDAGCGTGYGLAILADSAPAELVGVDIDPDAVADANGRVDGRAQVVQGDLHALELPDDSFDVAVCFETIEHLVSPQEALAELRRVLRPGGTIVVSSPNPDVYPGGNEHHLHELRPDELRQLVQGHFEGVRVYLQHAWLASAIDPANDEGAAANGDGVPTNGSGVRRTSWPRTSGTTYAIVVGSDAEPPEPSPLISLGDPFEVRWWEERVSEAERRASELESSATARLPQLELESSRRLREAAEREAKLRERLQETSAALIDANQELAQAPVLKHRLAELYAHSAGLEAQVKEVFMSRSWRLTAFLRRWRAALKPRN